MDIIRILPDSEFLNNKPVRFSEEDFDDIKKDEFKKWFSGINPKTGRKCKVNGKTHNKLRDVYGFRYYDYYKNISEVNDSAFYIIETRRIFKQWEAENKIIDNLIIKIKNLNWDEYIEFRGVKYGIPEICDKIYKKDDCNGELINDHYESCSCHLCEDWGGCRSSGRDYYKCNKCGWTYSEERRQYRLNIAQSVNQFKSHVMSSYNKYPDFLPIDKNVCLENKSGCR